MKEELKAEFTKMLPGGVLDDSTYEQIEDALDRAEAPCTSVTGGWLLLSERITLFAAIQKKEMEALRARLALLESVLAEAKRAVKPFANAYHISIKPFGEAFDDDTGARDYLAGRWPTCGNFREAATVSAKIHAMDAALKEKSDEA